MQNKTFISSMVGVAAAVAVAGSANAAIVTTGAISPPVFPGAGNVTSVVLTTNGSYATSTNEPFAIPAFWDYSASASSVFMGGSGESSAATPSGFVVEFAATRSTYRSTNNYAAGTMIDSSIGTLSDTAASGSGFFYGDQGFILKMNGTSVSTPGQFKNASGYVAFRFSSNTTNGVDGNWYYGWIAYTGQEATGGLTGWGYNTVADQGILAGEVPAPGALALLGVAGLAGARRRRA